MKCGLKICTPCGLFENVRTELAQSVWEDEQLKVEQCSTFSPVCEIMTVIVKKTKNKKNHRAQVMFGALPDD